MSSNTDRMATMNISLPEALRRFVEARAVARYGSVSEYIRELIREDERRASAELAEDTLLKGLSQANADSGEIRAAIEGIRRLRAAVEKRGAALSTAEITAEVRKGRR